jgi:polysaccharide biosynthesis protein PslH
MFSAACRILPSNTTEQVANRPKLLFITIDLPRDGGSGGQIASWRLLETYARVCDVDVIAIAPSGGEVHPELERLARRIELVRVRSFHFARARLRTIGRFLAAQFTSSPYRIAKFRNRRVSRVVQLWAAGGEYDLVHCDHLSAAQYRALLPNARAILMEHNVEWQILARLSEAHGRAFARLILRRDARRTRSWEAHALRRFDHVFTLSVDDRQELLRRCPDLPDRISVWPVPVRRSPIRDPREGNAVLTILVMGSLRSVGRVEGLRWLLREVWPGLRRVVPDARLEVVGADPPDDISGQDGRNGIRVHGYVESLDDILVRTDVCAIPLFVGGGIRIKVLELIARGIPCFGTEVALKGLGWLPGCLELDSAEHWTEALIAAADQRTSLRAEAAVGAAELASRHGARAAAGELDRVLSELRVIGVHHAPTELAFADVA